MGTPKYLANSAVGRCAGVVVGESRIDAARKAIAVMEMAGMDTRKAEKMLADAIARGVQ